MYKKLFRQALYCLQEEKKKRENKKIKEEKKKRKEKKKKKTSSIAHSLLSIAERMYDNFSLSSTSYFLLRNFISFPGNFKHLRNTNKP